MKENLCDVKALREIYENAMEYLKSKEKLDNFQNKMDNGAENYKGQVEKENGLDKLYAESKKLSKKLDKYDKLKSIDYDDDYPDDEYEKFTEEQVEDYFETQKKYWLLQKKISKLEEKINNKYFDYYDKQQEENQNLLKALKEKVIDTGLKLIDMEDIKSENELKFDLDKIKDMLVNNEYICSYKSYDDKNNDYSGEVLARNNLLDNWFKYLSREDKLDVFTSEKLSKKYPSTFEYFVSQLEKQTGKKYKKINIITNDTWCVTDHYEPDSYYVYGATLLLPENLAEAFEMVEKKHTSKSIENFVEKHKDVILLNGKGIMYYDGYKYIPWVEYGKKEKVKVEDKTKFNEEYRKQAREELVNSEESNRIDLKKMFDVKETSFLSSEEIIGNLPPKFIADAIFDTLEYAKKLKKYAKLEKIVENQKEQQKAIEDFEALSKEM